MFSSLPDAFSLKTVTYVIESCLLEFTFTTQKCVTHEIISSQFIVLVFERIIPLI